MPLVLRGISEIHNEIYLVAGVIFLLWISRSVVLVIVRGRVGRCVPIAFVSCSLVAVLAFAVVFAVVIVILAFVVIVFFAVFIMMGCATASGFEVFASFHP